MSKTYTIRCSPVSIGSVPEHGTEGFFHKKFVECVEAKAEVSRWAKRECFYEAFSYIDGTFDSGDTIEITVGLIGELSRGKFTHYDSITVAIPIVD